MQVTQTRPGTQVTGLSTDEVSRRRAAGQANTPPPSTTRSYWQILRENLFTFSNNVLFALGIALVLVHRPLDALTSGGVVLLNTMVSVVQEVRAKRTLDKVALLNRPKATAVRDGTPVELSQQELVLGDVLQLGSGDQVVLDGRVLDGRLEMDESALTGESEHVPKKSGDLVYSGTFCVAGSGFYEATAVGNASMANRITAGARTFRRVLTPLEREVRLVVRLLLAVMILLQLLLTLRAVLLEVPVADAVGNATVVAGLVPNGLFLSISIAYAIGAVRLVQTGLLIQQSNAVESLSNVDMLLTDKTGTLTTNHLKVSTVQPAQGVTEQQLKQSLGILAASTTAGNKTSRAIAEAFPADAQPVVAEVPFSSAREWSAIATSTGVLAMGAPEAMKPHLLAGSDSDLVPVAARWRAQGLRVLLIAEHRDAGSLASDGLNPQLPSNMQPLGTVAISDELREGVGDTLAEFRAEGVTVKIVSGDNPETVAALARQAGMQGDLTTASGSDLAGLDEKTLADLAERTTVFGRIEPQDKARLVSALRAKHHYVAMLGDGVNDVLALKGADLAIAMHGGSQAASGVADIVLLNDSFSALTPAVAEGQRIRNGMQSILKLYLTRIGNVTSIIVASLVIGLFPIDVRNGSAVTIFSVGIPSVALTLWARPGPVRGRALGRDLFAFVTPAVILCSMIGVGLFYLVLFMNAGFPEAQAGQTQAQLAQLIATVLPLGQTALTAFLVFCGLALFAMVTPARVDRRPLLLACGLGVVFLIMLVTPLRVVFELHTLNPNDIIAIVVALAVWLVLFNVTWRERLIERYLDLPDDTEAPVS